MKKVSLIVAVVGIVVIGVAKAQVIEATTYIEKTHISPKLGTSIAWIFDNQIEVGGFFQQSTVELQAEKGRPLMAENELYGTFMAYPLISNPRANVKLNVRTGVSNGENFVITPSFQGNVKAAKMVTLGAGVGVRSMRPTMMASLKINI